MIFRIVFFFCILSTFGLGQTGPANAIGPVLVTVYAEGSSEGLLGLRYQSAGKSLVLPVTRGGLSGQFKYTGPQEFLIFNEVKTDDKVKRIERAKVTIPEGASEVLLLMGENNRQVSLLAVDTSSSRFGVGYVLVLNFSGQPLALKIGGSQAMIENKGSAILGPVLSAGEPVECVAAAQLDGNWRKIVTGYYTPIPEYRNIMFLRSGTQSNTPDMIILNYRSSSKKKAESAVR
jgi:hypothetical protein